MIVSSSGWCDGSICFTPCVTLSLIETDDVFLLIVSLHPGEHNRCSCRRALHDGGRPQTGHKRLQWLWSKSSDEEDGQSFSGKFCYFRIIPFSSLIHHSFIWLFVYQNVSLQMRMKLQLLHLTAGMKTNPAKLWRLDHSTTNGQTETLAKGK